MLHLDGFLIPLSTVRIACTECCYFHSALHHAGEGSSIIKALFLKVRLARERNIFLTAKTSRSTHRGTLQYLHHYNLCTSNKQGLSYWLPSSSSTASSLEDKGHPPQWICIHGPYLICGAGLWFPSSRRGMGGCAPTTGKSLFSLPGRANVGESDGKEERYSFHPGLVLFHTVPALRTW